MADGEDGVGLILMAAGIFAGLFVFIATMYSLSQAVLTEGRTRRAHVAAIVAVLAVMGALSFHAVGLARILSLPLIGAAIWTFQAERGAFRVFPVLLLLFGLIVLAGFVVL